MKKRIMAILLTCAVLLVLTAGCGLGTDAATKLRDLEFTVVSEEKLPQELKALIEERKASEFKITYADDEFLYICIGYGQQKTGGYSIAVDELYLTENAIYVCTSLLGPGSAEKTGPAASYPYIVIKTDYLDKTVVFE